MAQAHCNIKCICIQHQVCEFYYSVVVVVVVVVVVKSDNIQTIRMRYWPTHQNEGFLNTETNVLNTVPLQNIAQNEHKIPMTCNMEYYGRYALDMQA